MAISRQQKQTLYDDGYVVIPSLLPDQLINQARQAINRSFGQGIDPDRLVEFQHQSFCPELRTAPVIHDLLLHENTQTIVEDLIGPGAVDKTSIRPQMAIRFPSMDDRPGEIHPHLDGMYTPTNGLQPGDIWSHTLLVGVFLSDVQQKNCGNFTAWPGSHHVYEKFFRDKGPQALLDGMPPVNIGEPRQLLVNAGDVLFAHYELGHTVGPHIGPDVRYTVFFRIRHPRHEQQKWEAMTNIWMEWPGMSEVVSPHS